MRRIALSLVLIVLLVTTLLVLGQGSGVSQPSLRIKVSNQSCDMTLAQSDATVEAAVSDATPEISTTEEAPSYPLITLGNNCANVLTTLHVPNNDTLWIALWVDENESPWQQFKRVPGDEHAPKLDTRGRFVGCAIPEKGEQSCRLLWTYDETTYEVEIPVTVRDAYVAPTAGAQAVVPIAPTNTSVVPVSTPNSGVWGDCGSCTTCGGPVEHCVLAPDNTCVWDARRCENPKHPDPSHP